MNCGGIFDYEGSTEKLEELDAQTAEPGFWDDADAAQTVVREQSTIKRLIEVLDEAGEALDEGERIEAKLRRAVAPRMGC